MEVIKDRVRIEKYPDGFVVKIYEKNWVREGNFMTPCIVHYNGLDYQVDNDYIIRFTNENQDTITGEKMVKILPQLLEHGEMIPFRKTKYIK